MKKKHKKEEKGMIGESKKKRDSTISGSAMHKEFTTRDTVSHATDKATVFNSYSQYPTLGFSEILKD